MVITEGGYWLWSIEIKLSVAVYGGPRRWVIVVVTGGGCWCSSLSVATGGGLRWWSKVVVTGGHC